MSVAVIVQIRTRQYDGSMTAVYYRILRVTEKVLDLFYI